MPTKLQRSIIPRVVCWLLTAGIVCACDRNSTARRSTFQALEPVIVAQSDSSAEFSRIMGMGVDSHGQVYAGDQLGEIFVFDQRGKFIRKFGRMGGGPGEYQLLGPVHPFAGDSLFVFDALALRATIYAPGSDRVAYTVRLPEPNLSFPMDVEPLRTGHLISHFRRINGDFPSTGQKRDDVIRILNKDGSIRDDSVLAIPEPDVVAIKSGTGQGFFSPAFARRPLVEWDSEGRIYTLWSDSTRVTIHAPDGHVTGSFSPDLGSARFPLRDATIDSVAERNAGGDLTSRALREAFRSRWQTWPLVEQMLVDDQSRIWIKPVTHDSIGDWFAFTPTGERVASFRLPQTVTPRLIRGDRLYGVSRDSLDVESVVVYRLTPSSTRTPERP
jgi:hypothetical protein